MTRGMFRWLAAAVVAVSLSACQSPIQVTPEMRAQVKSVAVVSATGDRLRWVEAGLIGAVDRAVIAVPDWQLDDRIEQAAAKALKPHYKVVGFAGARRADMQDAKDLGAEVKRQAAAGGLDADAVLVVREGSRGTNVGGGTTTIDAPQSLTGIGLFSRMMVAGRSVGVNAVLDLKLIDPKSGQEIAWAKQSLAMPTLAVTFLRYPLDKAQVEWANPFEAMSAKDRQLVEATAQLQAEAAVVKKLREGGIIP